MPRYPQEQKETTRRRILERSAERLKSAGVQGSGVATLMADAGLTNGAFYAHFESKDALVAAVVAGELTTQADAMGAPAGPTAAEDLVRHYLSPAHRDDPAHGCPQAALLSEIARSTVSIREAYTAGIGTVADALLALVGTTPGPSARARMLAALAGMVGTLQMARAVTDPTLSDALLEQGVQHALLALGVTPSAPSVAADPTHPGAAASAPSGNTS